MKNPKAARSRLVATWAQRCARVLLMSGTPMDNRLEDFLALVDLLHPGLSESVPKHLGLVGPEAFRRAVAHVYLRRNQSDVLVELPDVVASDDWVELGAPEEAHYRATVASGNLMAMRQAAWHAPEGAAAPPAKLDRLLEIVDEARDEGRSVLVFSYFRATLALVATDLVERGVKVHGPLTGNVPVARRGELVDAFTADAAAVLVAQVSVGGTGLNLQAASVVVLCEPQLTPSLEDQAIARAHRMGQVRPVRVHRLLGADGVDERIVEILASKREVFDDYVRVSSLAQAAVGSVDVARVISPARSSPPSRPASATDRGGTSSRSRRPARPRGWARPLDRASSTDRADRTRPTFRPERRASSRHGSDTTKAAPRAGAAFVKDGHGQRLNPSARSWSLPSSVIFSGPHGGIQIQLTRYPSVMPSRACPVWSSITSVSGQAADVSVMSMIAVLFWSTVMP